MADRIDDLLARLAASEGDPGRDLVPGVLTSIAETRRRRRAAQILNPVCAISVGFAAVLGLTVGGLTAAAGAAEPHQLNTFSTHLALAPSTLLEGSN